VRIWASSARPLRRDEPPRRLRPLRPGWRKGRERKQNILSPEFSDRNSWPPRIWSRMPFPPISRCALAGSRRTGLFFDYLARTPLAARVAGLISCDPLWKPESEERTSSEDAPRHRNGLFTRRSSLDLAKADVQGDTEDWGRAKRQGESARECAWRGEDPRCRRH